MSGKPAPVTWSPVTSLPLSPLRYALPRQQSPVDSRGQTHRLSGQRLLAEPGRIPRPRTPLEGAGNGSGPFPPAPPLVPTWPGADLVVVEVDVVSTGNGRVLALLSTVAALLLLRLPLLWGTQQQRVTSWTWTWARARWGHKSRSTKK